MRLFFEYIRQYRLPALMFCTFSAIFAIIFYLYDLRAESVLYAALLCVATAISAITIHFLHFRRKYLYRSRISGNVSLVTEILPEPDTPAEKQYIEMIEKLRKINYDIQSSIQKDKTDSIDFYTAWVHQIKTPISVMQMMLQTEDTEEYRAMSAELFRIEQYTEMALCWSRLGSGPNDLIISKIQLDDVIRSSIRKYAPQFVRRKIRLIYSRTQESALSDKKWLGFIIDQLLSNAVKYTDNGSVMISVKDGRISIADTGIGIVPEDLPRIFEKGYTGYNGRENKKSTGLGLYLSKKAADKLSHKIYAESEVGKGSIFTVDLHTDIIKPE